MSHSRTGDDYARTETCGLCHVRGDAVDQVASLRNQLLRIIRDIKTTLRTHTAAIVAINAKTQRTAVTTSLAAGTNDITITWPTPWPDTIYWVGIELVSAAVQLGNLHATLKAGSKTTTDCVVTVSAVSAVASVGVDVVGMRT